MHHYGHRGFSSLYPENTILAHVKALEVGIYGLETDLRITKDNEIILMHDYSVDRTTNGSGAVVDLSYKDYISKLHTVTSIKDQAESIPLLQDLLDLISLPAYSTCRVILDIKEDNPLSIMSRLQDILNSYSLSQRIIIGVWNMDFLVKAKALFPAYQMMLILEHWPPSEDLMLSHSVDCFSVDWMAVKDSLPDAVQAAHNANKKLYVWVLNHKDSVDVARNAHVDAIITDNAKICKE